MNNKPNDPEECINPKKMALWTDTKVNYWLFIGMATGLANEILFHAIVPPLNGVLREDFLTWPVGIRLIFESVPLLAGLPGPGAWHGLYAAWMNCIAVSRLKRGFLPWRRSVIFPSGRCWMPPGFQGRFTTRHIFTGNSRTNPTFFWCLGAPGQTTQHLSDSFAAQCLDISRLA